MTDKLDLDALERIANVSVIGNENRRQIIAALSRLRELERASQPGSGEDAQAALRVMTALQDEARKRRHKYQSQLYSARDVDPDVYDIAKGILERAGRITAARASLDGRREEDRG